VPDGLPVGALHGDGPRRRGQVFVQQRADAGFAGLHHQRYVGDRSQRHRVRESSGQRRRRDQHHFLLVERLGPQRTAGGRQFGQPQLGVAAADFFSRRRRAPGVHDVEQHPGVLPSEFPGDQGEGVHRQGGHDGEVELSGGGGPHLLHGFPGSLHVPQDAAGRLGEGLAVLGQHELAAGPVEELHPQLPLQVPDRLRQGRLRDEQRLRCLGDAAVLHDGDEVLHQPELPAPLLREPRTSSPCILSGHVLVLRFHRDIGWRSAWRRCRAARYPMGSRIGSSRSAAQWCPRHRHDQRADEVVLVPAITSCGFGSAPAGRSPWTSRCPRTKLKPVRGGVAAQTRSQRG